MNFEEIKASIPMLTLEERAELASCLHGWEDDDWDRQMKADFQTGKFTPLLSKVDRDIVVAASAAGRAVSAPRLE